MPLEEAHFKKCAIYGATKVYPKNHMAPILRLWCVDPLKRVHGAQQPGEVLSSVRWR